MKNFWAAFICSAMILSSSLCLATVDNGKIVLGGITPGMTEAELIDAFGQPLHKSGDDWTYKNFKVEVERGIVEKVSTRSEFLAADGVRVGLKAEVLNDTFGRADEFDRDYDGEEYEYDSIDRTKTIKFKVVNGIIVKITCELKD